MKLAITTLLFVVFLLFLGHFQITFKPFSISMPYWYRAVGLLLFSLAMVLYNLGEYNRGYKKGVKDGAEATIQMIKDKTRNEQIGHTESLAGKERGKFQ